MKAGRGMNKGRGCGQGTAVKKNQGRIAGKGVCLKQSGHPKRTPPEGFFKASAIEKQIFHFQPGTTNHQIRAFNEPDIGMTDSSRQPEYPVFVLKADVEACLLCGVCEEVCLAGAVSVGEAVEVDGEKCFGCGQCVEACPADALSLMSVE